MDFLFSVSKLKVQNKERIRILQIMREIYIGVVLRGLSPQLFWMCVSKKCLHKTRTFRKLFKAHRVYLIFFCVIFETLHISEQRIVTTRIFNMNSLQFVAFSKNCRSFLIWSLWDRPKVMPLISGNSKWLYFHSLHNSAW